jgi:hypothetical protein
VGDWLAIADNPITRDGMIQAFAVILSSIVAVLVGLLAARLGANATLSATERAVEADREATRIALQEDLKNQRALQREQRLNDELATLVALQAELQLNSKLADAPISKWYPVVMERAALDRALPLLSSMQSNNSEAIEQAWSRIAAYNTVAAAVRSSPGTNPTNVIQNEAQQQARDAKPVFDQAISSVASEIARRSPSTDQRADIR